MKNFRIIILLIIHSMIIQLEFGQDCYWLDWEKVKQKWGFNKIRKRGNYEI